MRPDSHIPRDAIAVWVAQQDGILHGLTADADAIVQVAIPSADGSLITRAHGLAVDRSQRVHVLTGRAATYLSTYDPLTNTWTHRTHPGMGIAGVVGAGGVAIVESAVFVTDMQVPTGRLRGLVRFPLTDAPVTRVSRDEWPQLISLATGGDGRLWLLGQGGEVISHDPESGSDGLGFSAPGPLSGVPFRGIAVASDGTIFLASTYGELLQLSPDGSLLARLTAREVPAASPGLVSVDVRSDGLLVAGTARGDVLITRMDLASSVLERRPGASVPVEVAFAPQ